jgi:hypothetical protein
VLWEGEGGKGQLNTAEGEGKRVHGLDRGKGLLFIYPCRGEHSADLAVRFTTTFTRQEASRKKNAFLSEKRPHACAV